MLITTATQRAQRSKKFNLARNFQSRSKILISLEILMSTSRFPTKDRAAVGGSLENSILARNFQSRSKSRFFWSLGPLGKSVRFRRAQVMSFSRELEGSPQRAWELSNETLLGAMVAEQQGAWEPDSCLILNRRQEVLRKRAEYCFESTAWKGGKTPAPKISALLRNGPFY